MDNLFNVNQAAYILKVHPLTVRRYIKEGTLPAVKAGGNIRIPESALQAFNKKIDPNEPTLRIKIKDKPSQSKQFTLSDPFFRLEGRGATFQLSE